MWYNVLNSGQPIKIQNLKEKEIMTTETMTIHRGLAELKIIDERINKAIRETAFVTVNKHSNAKIDGLAIDEAKEIIKSNYDRINSLINRKNAIKRSVVLSNARTEVTINGVVYTIAEAIDMKNHGIESKSTLKTTLETQNKNAKGLLLRENGQGLSDRAEAYVTGLYGGKDTKSDPKVIDQMKKDFIESNSYDLIDPIGIEKVLIALDEEISTFRAEVDATLSESNAITQITIEY